MKKVLIWSQYWMIDAQLAEPVRAAIESLTEHGEETVFYFLDRTEFSALCLSQLRARIDAKKDRHRDSHVSPI